MLLASRALVAVAARSVPGDVTLPQYRALVVLATRGAQSSSALATELGIVPSSVTRLCDRLERKELVVREAVEGDRRQVQLQVTDAGRRLVDRVTEARRVALIELVHGIPPERRPDLIDALNVLGHAAGETPEQAWSIGWGG